MGVSDMEQLHWMFLAWLSLGLLGRKMYRKYEYKFYCAKYGFRTTTRIEHMLRYWDVLLDAIVIVLGPLAFIPAIVFMVLYVIER